MPTFHCSKWPGCDCPDGTVYATCPGLNDRRNVIVHPPIEGENLRKARLAADEPFPRTPWEIGKALAVAAILVLTGFALCAMQMEIPV